MTRRSSLKPTKVKTRPSGRSANKMKKRTKSMSTKLRKKMGRISVSSGK